MQALEQLMSSAAGKGSLVLLQLGQIQNQWGLMATVEKEGSKICVVWKEEGWLQGTREASLILVRHSAGH